MVQSLCALAAIYEAGRRLWPVDDSHPNQTVTLEIGQLKAMSISEASGKWTGEESLEGRSIWVLTQRNSCEAALELVPAAKVNELVCTGIHFWGVDWSDLGSDEGITAADLVN
mmetsp:Transcript_79046/g.205449  ORF Transcript_79046/g.205449 Transcript_79046/m.205449 type:complete len:113 (-) Transcript_79046:3-341(-)